MNLRLFRIQTDGVDALDQLAVFRIETLAPYRTCALAAGDCVSHFRYKLDTQKRFLRDVALSNRRRDHQTNTSLSERCPFHHPHLVEKDSFLQMWGYRYVRIRTARQFYWQSSKHETNEVGPEGVCLMSRVAV